MKTLNAYEHYFKYRYLLVDNLVALQDEYPLSKESLLVEFGADKMTQVMRTDISHEPDFCPTLITLAEPVAYFEHQTLENIITQTAIECFWSKRYVCAVIISELAPQALAEKIIKIGDTIANILQEPYYPFFEPFRMELLHQTASFDDQRWLFSQFSATERYYYPSIHHGNLVEYSVDMNGKTNENWSSPYLERLKKLKLIRTLVNAWANNRYRRESEKDLPLAEDVIIKSTHLVEQAVKLGLTDNADILFWGLNGLAFKIDFAQYPEALKLVAKAIRAPGTLSQEFVNTQETIWNNVIAAQQVAIN